MSKQDGFTVVELIVTILIAAVMALAIFQLSSASSRLASESSLRANASSLAYNNLRKYANGNSPFDWFVCNGDETGETTPPFSDGKTYPNATGQEVINTTSSVSINKLPPPVVQYVIAIAPYGCGNSGKGLPIRVQSQVTYGSGSTQRTVTHATYISY